MTPTFGVDISAHQWRKAIPFAQIALLKRVGIRFVICRAGIGLTADTSFAGNRERLAKAGFIVGAYWYVNGEPAAQQAEAFASRINKTGGADDLLIAVDVEGDTDGYADVRAFVETLRVRVPRHDVILYTNYSTWIRLGRHDASVLFDALWQALYTVNHQEPPLSAPARPPHGLGGLPTSIWQMGPFVIGGHRLDGNAAYISLDALRGLASQRDRVPLPQRPAYIAGYGAMTDVAALAVGALLISDGSPTFKLGQEAAKADAFEAVSDLRLVP